MKSFLKDVLMCSLGAYGGPETHISVFIDILVVKKKYLSEKDLIELTALCSILPGPTSTQVITSVGYRTGGPKLAMLTMLVWSLPVLVIMTLLSFLYQLLALGSISFDFLRFIGPMAVGFIAVAAVRIGRKVVTDALTALLLVLSAAATWFIRSPWIFPAVLIAAGSAASLLSGEKSQWNRVSISPPWRYLILFLLLAAGTLAAALLFAHPLVQIAENFYRYGYLVFGGGQVVVPVMHTELVQVSQYMTNEEFLTGYGLVQGLPGPMFSFAAYAGGMAARGSTVFIQILGAAAGGIGIFLPGLLLIFFVYPVWESLKQIRGIQTALRGITAAAGGMIAASAVVLIQSSGIGISSISVMLLSAALLLSGKIPAPLIVALMLVIGMVL